MEEGLGTVLQREMDVAQLSLSWLVLVLVQLLLLLLLDGAAAEHVGDCIVRPVEPAKRYFSSTVKKLPKI